MSHIKRPICVYSKPGIIEEIEQRGEIGHAASYVASLYLPRLHAEHSPPLVPANPALHLHAVNAELSTTEDEFPGHAEHSPSFVPANPALHLHAVNAELPTTEDEFPGHVVQTSLEIPCLNVPLEHGVHAPGPGFVASAPWPALHMQVLLFGGVILLRPHSSQSLAGVIVI